MKTKLITTILLLATLLFSGCGFLLDDYRPGRHTRHSVRDRRDHGRDHRDNRHDNRRSDHRDNRRHDRDDDRRNGRHHR